MICGFCQSQSGGYSEGKADCLVLGRSGERRPKSRRDRELWVGVGET